MHEETYKSLRESIYWAIMILIIVIAVQSKPKDPEVIITFGDVIFVNQTPIVDTKEPVKIEVNDILQEPVYGFTDDEIYLMTVLLSGSKDVDGDGEYDIDYGNRDNYEQISLVLSVIMNRINSEHFPNTVTEVIWQQNQFSPMARWTKGLPEVSDISYQIVKQWCENYDTYGVSILTIPDNHLYFWGNGVINQSRERWYN